MSQLPGIGKRTALRFGAAFAQTTERADRTAYDSLAHDAQRDKKL